MDKASTITSIALFIVVAIYVLWNIFQLLLKIGKDYTMMTNRTSLFHKRLRKWFYLGVSLELRKYVRDYCSRYSGHKGSTVEAIIMYELDLSRYRTVFIEQGYPKLFVDTLTKLEEIKKFTDDWRQVNNYLTSKEILELYLNETKP